MASKSSRSRPKAGTRLPISEPGASDKDVPHYHGHRQRLRERFLDGGADALPDYELLELFLFFAIPQRDTKPLAKALIARFGSFADVIAAPAERLMEVEGVKEGTVTALKIIEAAALRLARTRIIGRPALSSWEALLDYCAADLGLGPLCAPTSGADSPRAARRFPVLSAGTMVRPLFARDRLDRLEEIAFFAAVERVPTPFRPHGSGVRTFERDGVP